MIQELHRTRAEGFTLIELLIVVAIIAILAAIAVPNFLDAQMRSKVSRVKADIRSMVTAVESYAVDHNGYPIAANEHANPILPYPSNGPEFFDTRISVVLTTPKWIEHKEEIAAIPLHNDLQIDIIELPDAAQGGFQKIVERLR